MLQAFVLVADLHGTSASHHSAAPRSTSAPTPMRTPLPTPTPLQVTVTNPHAPDYVMYGLTCAAVVFAGLAWWVSRRDFTLNKDQATKADAERAKKPVLVLTFAHTLSAGATVDEEGRYRTHLTVYVTNYGTAPANNIHVSLSFPADIVEQDESAPGGVAKEGKIYSIRLSDMVDSFGNRYARVYDRNLEVLPSEPPFALAWGTFFVRPVESHVLWHIKCREGEFPGGNRENTATLYFGPMPTDE